MEYNFFIEKLVFWNVTSLSKNLKKKFTDIYCVPKKFYKVFLVKLKKITNFKIYKIDKNVISLH